MISVFLQVYCTVSILVFEVNVSLKKITFIVPANGTETNTEVEMPH